jgi:DNA-binding response OmpR family regulator
MTVDTPKCDVLLAEDDLSLNDLMTSYLRRGGLDVCAAHSGSSALRLLSKFTPRLAVLDYRLPDQTGAQLAQKLREVLPELPIIIMSGALGDLEQRAFEQIGVKAFVNKPVPLRALLRACTSLLEKGD